MYQKKRDQIITELYTTGKFNGEYFGKRPRGTTNPVRGYIAMQYKKRHLQYNESDIDDCYSETFLALSKMDAQKVCEIYAESPNKLIATVLQLVVFKCFANDNKPVPNPQHSLVGRLNYMSALSDNCVEVGASGRDGYTNGASARVKEEAFGVDYIEPTSGFANKFGCEVEDIIDKLNPQQRADFYEMSAKGQRSNESVARRAKRSELYGFIIDIKEEFRVATLTA